MFLELKIGCVDILEVGRRVVFTITLCQIGCGFLFTLKHIVLDCIRSVFESIQQFLLSGNCIHTVVTNL